MKALSLLQPWASAIMLGGKRIETRSWKTEYRGLIAIHASKKMPKNTRYVLPPDLNLPLGAILGTVTLSDVKRVEEVKGNLSAWELALGDYSDGRWAWLLTDIMPFDQPIYCKGALGLWKVPEEIGEQLIERLIYGG